jgi:acetolactate synthase-1/2/3 large subunit
MVDTATRQLTGAQVLVGALEQHGVRYLFGVPGHGAYPIYDALNDFPNVRPVVGRNEQGAVFSADGYARVSEDVAVATSVPLAGVTNSLTSLWEANGHGSRLLYLIEYDPQHEAFLRPIARHYRHAWSVAEIAPTVHELMARLRTERPGLAVLEVPNGVLHSEGRVDLSDGFRAPSPRGVDAARIAEAAHLLSGAARPVICAGGFAWGRSSGQVLTRLAEQLQAPVLTGPMSKGAIADDHPLCLGFNWNVGGHAERLLTEADVVLGIGPRAGMVAGERSPAVLARQLIHLDWDGAEQGPTVPARLQLNGYLPTLLAGLAEAVRPRHDPAWPAATLDRVRGAARANASERIPHALPFFQALRDALPREALLFTDSLAGLWAFRLFPAYAPNTVHFPWFTGTLGHGVPAAVGAALAAPDRPIAILAGDGAFLYNSQELATMKLYHQKLIVVIANDNTYSAILFNMTDRFGRSGAHELANPDLVSLGAAYGMRAVRLTALSETGPALRDALAASSPSLIEVPLQLKPPRL